MPPVITRSQLEELADVGEMTIRSVEADIDGMNWVANLWLTAFSEHKADAQFARVAEQCCELLASLHTLLTVGENVGHARFNHQLSMAFENKGGELNYLLMLSQLDKLEGASASLAEQYTSKRGRPSGGWLATNLTVLLVEYYRLNGTKTIPSNDCNEEAALRNPQFRFVRKFIEIIDNAAKNLREPPELDDPYIRRGVDFINEMKCKSAKGLIDLLRKASKEAQTLLRRETPYGYKIEQGMIIPLERDPFLDP